jgi:hypothetical protein
MPGPIKKENITLWSEPNYNSWWEVLAKLAIGLWVGIVIAFLVFIILYMVNSMMTQALSNNTGTTGATTVNPLIPLILLVIAFIATFIGNVMLAWVYNLFYSTKYYDLWKMFSNGLLSNVIIFFAFIPLYLIYYNSINNLFIVLWFHIIFAIFTCYTHVEIMTNPNYSSSHLIGTTIWVAISAMLFIVIQNVFEEKDKNWYILLIPPFIGYICIPFFHALWEKIYYKFYENGNDFLYLPTLQEINIQDKMTNQATTNNDITVDLG